MFKLPIFTLLLVFLCSFIQAQQSLSFENDFKLSELDNDAVISFAKKDINGKLMALIKIFNQNKIAEGVSVSIGTVGDAFIEYKPDKNEIWIYVPKGTYRFITFNQKDLGKIQEPYFFPKNIVPEGVESGKVYTVTLLSARLESAKVVEEQNTGFLTIKSNPDKASIIINGGIYNGETGKQTPILSEEIPPGYYKISLRKPNYKNWDTSFTVKFNDKVILNPQLKPNFGSVKIVLEPEINADIYLDEQNLEQKTPNIIKQVGVGKHKIQLTKELYKSYEQDVEIKAGDEKIIKVKLEPTFAKLTISSTPTDAEIFIRKGFVGKGNYAENLNQGSYFIEVKKNNFITQSKVIVIKPQQDITENIVLKPITGGIVVKSDPENADIYIDKEKLENTTPTIINNYRGVLKFKQLIIK
ncbi:MAG: PEGA domain-containing protein [Sediminibacterium sp.]|nr:PEGA domain-containing protein [Sediminibacterium sp.]